MRPTRSIKEVLGQWMKNSGKGALFVELRIKEEWENLLGAQINEKTLSIHWVSEEKMLLVKINDALLKNELRYAKDSIREKLNAHLDDVKIKKIVFV